MGLELYLHAPIHHCRRSAYFIQCSLSVQYVVSSFASLCCLLITPLTFLIFFLCFLVFYFVYSVFCTVLCTVSPLVHSCLFPIFAEVYRPLLPGANPVAVNKYHIIYTCYLSHTYSRLYCEHLDRLWVTASHLEV